MGRKQEENSTLVFHTVAALSSFIFLFFYSPFLCAAVEKEVVDPISLCGIPHCVYNLHTTPWAIWSLFFGARYPLHDDRDVNEGFPNWRRARNVTLIRD